ncbi:DNA-processing protein DprA [Roseiconus lacunae]|uniref:DNA-processing protein DprA n=1 Tax=Roseiconus lacunae TaxID=2605694 RepID=UPI003088F97A|nr:DNA-processing protein DprA [Stieleria sp. HD01]
MIRETTPAELLGALNDFEERNAPASLWIRGDAEILTNGGRVSIVGSRNASSSGLNRASRLARLLCLEGIVIVSGLAKGIDTASHTAAIESGGKTVGVIGTAIDKYYPRENRSLQESIATEHLLVSQFAPGARTYGSSFTQRNRTMALIADATVIVEAGEKSGTIHQGWEAIRLGRPLFIMKSLVDTDLKWVRDMMYYGASLLSDDTVEDLIAAVPPRVSAGEDVFAF